MNMGKKYIEICRVISYFVILGSLFVRTRIQSIKKLHPERSVLMKYLHMCLLDISQVVKVLSYNRQYL